MNVKCYSHLLCTPFQNEGVIGFKENYRTIEGILYFNRELEKRLCSEHFIKLFVNFQNFEIFSNDNNYSSVASGGKKQTVDYHISAATNE